MVRGLAQPRHWQRVPPHPAHVRQRHRYPRPRLRPLDYRVIRCRHRVGQDARPIRRHIITNSPPEFSYNRPSRRPC